MDLKRYNDIKWEYENDRPKFNQHAHEYFEEAMPLLEQLLVKKEKKEEKKHK